MFPGGFNPFPPRPHQLPANHPSHQVVPSNPSFGDASNMPPNGMQVQPQMGFSPPNMHTLNGLIAQMSNATNHLIALQSNQLALQQMMGLSNQNNPQAMTPVPGQFYNVGQNANLLNVLQQLSGNMVLPNMHGFAPNSMQNANQLPPMQMSNPSQLPYYNGPPCPSQVMAPDGLRQHVHQTPSNFVSPAIGNNGYRPPPVTSQLMQENLAAPLNGRPDQATMSPKFPSSIPVKPQENISSKAGENTTNYNNQGRNFPRKGFTRNPRPEGFQKSHFHQKNGKRKFDFADGRGRKAGSSMEGVQTPGSLHPAKEANERRRFLPTYTEQEIKQWREERRKNHPSNSNVKKQMQLKIDEVDAKARREQLKEILAKQAELGVEVAEIPSHYLAESENKVPGREENRGPFNKNDKFQNKHHKKRKHNRKARFSKKQRSEDTGPTNAPSSAKRSEPTLLKKLLSKDIRMDKLRLLQIFRFMVLNNFFKDEQERPLEFPSVVITENGFEGSVTEEKSFVTAEVDLEAPPEKSLVKNCNISVDDDSDGADDDDNSLHEEEEEGQREEGEITD